MIEELAVTDNSSEPDAPAPGKLEKADRIVTVIDRSDPDKIGGAAERLLAR